LVDAVHRRVPNRLAAWRRAALTFAKATAATFLSGVARARRITNADLVDAVLIGIGSDLEVFPGLHLLDA
jgi:hypothetical protein